MEGLFIALVFTFGASLAQEQCQVTVENGSLSFSPLPEGAENGDPQVDSGPLEVWYFLPTWFVDAVQPDSLPYSVLDDSIEAAQCSVLVPPPENCTTSSFDIADPLDELVSWWTPAIAVSCVGAFMAIVVVVAVSIFWCLWCCGYCGGGRKQRESNYMDCKTCTFTFILLLFALLVLAGAILAFFSNEQAYRSLEQFQQPLDETADVYAGDTMEEVDTLFCQFNNVSEMTFQQLESTSECLSELQQRVDQLEEDYATLPGDITDAVSQLPAIVNATATLQEETAVLQTALDTIMQNITELQANCDESFCDDLIPDPTTFTITVDFPDLSREAEALNDDSTNVNLTREAQQSQETLRNLSEAIEAAQSDLLNPAVVSELNQSIFDWMTEVTGAILSAVNNDQNRDDCADFDDVMLSENSSIGQVRECLVDQGFEMVQEYDIYRYVVGYAVASLACITVVLVLIGITLGLVGFRRDYRPYQRTWISHCGGIFLLIAVAFAMFVSALLFFVSAASFFFAVNAQNVCEGLEGPEYDGIVNVVDDTELWGGSLLGSFLFNDSNEVFSLSQALENCEEDIAMYTAFNMSSAFPPSLRVREFADETSSEVTMSSDETLETFDYTSDDFLSQDVEDIVQNLEDVNAMIGPNPPQVLTLEFNITEAIENLMTVQTMLTNYSGDTGLANQTEEIIGQLNALSANISDIEAQVSALQENTEQFSDSVTKASSVVNATKELAVKITEVQDAIRVIENYAQFAVYFADQIEEEVGRCQPVWYMYTQLHNYVCVEGVESLNGFWWSLGFAALFSIPLIIFAIVTSVFYIRMKYYVQEYFDSYIDYPLKAY